eukprot:5332905-Alexandrium_andersonii.AAC.1
MDNDRLLIPRQLFGNTESLAGCIISRQTNTTDPLEKTIAAQSKEQPMLKSASQAQDLECSTRQATAQARTSQTQ